VLQLISMGDIVLMKMAWYSSLGMLIKRGVVVNGMVIQNDRCHHAIGEIVHPGQVG